MKTKITDIVNVGYGKTGNRGCMMTNIIEIMTEEEQSQLSIINIKQDYSKIYEFWLDFWMKKNIGKNTINNLIQKYKNINMPTLAFLAFQKSMRPQKKAEVSERLIESYVGDKNITILSISAYGGTAASRSTLPVDMLESLHAKDYYEKSEETPIRIFSMETNFAISIKAKTDGGISRFYHV